MAFSHEKLRVYRAPIEFVAWTTALLESTPPGVSVKKQLDRASTSIPLNIAEGHGKFSTRDRIRLLQIANGPAPECAAALDVFVAKRLCENGRVEVGKGMLEAGVNQSYGLMSSLDSQSVREAPVGYRPETLEGVRSLEDEEDREED